MTFAVNVRSRDFQGHLPRYFRWIMALVVLVALLGAFRIGLERGLDHTIGLEAWGRLLFGIGGAITQMAHGGWGYVVDHAIERVLQQGGLTGDPKILASLGTNLPANLTNAALIDGAIQKAVHFPGPLHGVRGSSGDDPGLLDFVRIGFTLFGYNVLSLYLTYFLLVSLQAWAFFRTFRDRPAGLAILAVAVLSHLGIFVSSVFDLTVETLGSPNNPRFLSALAVIPGLHVGLAMLLGLEPSRLNAGLILLQAGMIVFAYWIRSSAVWVPFALLLLAAAAGIYFRSARRLWSVGLVAVLFFLHAMYLAVALNPVYSRAGDIGRHPMWHSIVYSLQFHPEWNTKYLRTYDGADGDNLTPMVAKKYLERHPPQNIHAIYFHEPSGTLKWTALESAVRGAFFEFLINDPKFVLGTFLVHKPRYLLREFRFYVLSIARLSWPWRSFVIVSGLAMIGFFVSSATERRAFTQAALLTVGGFIVSLTPIVLTVPTRSVISDQFFMLMIAGAAVSIAVSSSVLWAATSLAQSRGWLLRRTVA